MSKIHFMGHVIDRHRNLIDDTPVEFGNELHIQLNQQYGRVMTSEDFVCEIEWSFRQYYYNGPKYFAATGKARKTKAPGDWAASANALKRSKALEIEVDKQLPLIINH